MIAESTPFGGIELKQASNETKLYLANNRYNHDDWDRWFGAVIDVINSFDVSMWCYINCNWEEQPMWHEIGFGQTLLSSNARVMAQWHKQIVKNGVPGRTFLASGSLDNCGVASSRMQVDEPNTAGGFGLSHFFSFILVPFLVVAGVFFVPYCILSGHKKSRDGSSDRERRPLLSNMDESIRAYPAQLAGPKKPTVDGVIQC